MKKIIKFILEPFKIFYYDENGKRHLDDMKLLTTISLILAITAFVDAIS